MLKVNRKFVLCDWLLLDYWGGGEKIGRGSKVAAVDPEQQHRELKELFYYYYYCSGGFFDIQK